MNFLLVPAQFRVLFVNAGLTLKNHAELWKMPGLKWCWTTETRSEQVPVVQHHVQIEILIQVVQAAWSGTWYWTTSPWATGLPLALIKAGGSEFN